MKVSIFTALFFLAALSSFGQETVTVSSTIPEGKIAVYIYASKSTIVDFRKQQDYPIFLDGIEIARTHPGQYFIAAVSPGKHSFQVGKSKQRQIEMEFKTKQIYYFRVNQRKSKSRQSKDFEIQFPEDARKEINQLRTVDDRDIKDKQIAINKFEG